MKSFVKKWLLKGMQRLSSHPRLSHYLFNPRIRAINRRSVSRGVAIGLLLCCIPLPLQIIFAGLLSYWWRANFALAFIVSWINNPFTFVPINIVVYKIGATIRRIINPYSAVDMLQNTNSTDNSIFFFNIIAWIKKLGISFLIGLPIFSIILAITGYTVVNIFWRLDIHYQCVKRQKRLQVNKYKSK